MIEKPIHCVLNDSWFTKIALDEKRVEYREICEHWKKRIWDRRHTATHVAFARGYRKATIFRRIMKIDEGPCPYKGWDGNFYRIHFEGPAAESGKDVSQANHES